MKTDVIAVAGRKGRVEAALEQADKVIAYKEMGGKNALHLRLLTEEMMGLMRSVTGAEDGLFWIEDENGEYQLHLQVRTRLSGEDREKLLAVSTSGRNESAKGLMGRLRDFFDWGSDEDLAAYSGPLLMPDAFEHSTSPMLDWEWSMRRYETALNARVEKNDPGAREAWDELEKSVVMHVADDVKVSIHNGTVEMIILKKLA
jgi:hypothetical protein